MDLYQILRVSVDASPEEIKQAYNRLIKECRYNAQLNRKDIELAYRVLTNPKQRTQYDAKLDSQPKSDTVRTKRVQKIQKKIRPKVVRVRLTLRQKALIAAALLIVATFFYLLRFGYMLKSFSEGDILYNKVSHQRVGRILKIEENHSFGSKRADAYLVEMGTGRQQWIPQDVIKSYCQEP